jgi:hypothetical protein
MNDNEVPVSSPLMALTFEFASQPILMKNGFRTSLMDLVSAMKSRSVFKQVG